MTHVMQLHLKLAASLVAVLPLVAHAQTATLTVAHNDPDGIVTPGQTVSITATLAWTANAGLGRIGGDIRATDDRGIAANPQLPYVFNPLPAAVIQPGTLSDGSVVDVFIQSGDSSPFFGQGPVYPWGLQAGLVLTTFEWTAPTSLGPIEFSWVPDPAMPQTYMHPNPSVGPVAFQTTYLGTSLTVVPTPASALALLGLLALPPRRASLTARRHP